MADISVPEYQAFWTNKCKTLKSEYKRQIGQFPDTDTQLKRLFIVFCDNKDVARYMPALWVTMSNGHPLSERQRKIGRPTATPSLERPCLVPSMIRTVTLKDWNAVLKAITAAGQSRTPKSAAIQEDGFIEIRRHKRHSTNEKPVLTAASAAESRPPRTSPCATFSPP